jgi:hypothetical protein
MIRLMNRSSFGMLLAASLTLTACGADDLLRPDSARPSKLTLTSKSTASLASLNDTALVSARVLDQSGNAMDGVRLRWTLLTPGVVSREADGVYRAIGNGRATVVAQVDIAETGAHPHGYYASPVADTVVIEVRQRPARLTIAPVDTAFGALGAARQLLVQVTDARGNAMIDGPPALVWRSADAKIVSVDTNGVVRSLGEGSARVTVQAGDLSGATNFIVRPRLPHTSCMVFAQRRQTKQSCVTLEFMMHEREAGR